VLVDPLLAELDHLVEQAGHGRRPVDERAGQVPVEQQDGRVHVRQETQVERLSLGIHLPLYLHQPVEGVRVARLAQRLLGSEVVPDQAAGHAGRLGDVPDRRALDAALGEHPQRGVPDPGAGGEVVEVRFAHPKLPTRASS
jgi:hypothetical protein